MTETKLHFMTKKVLELPEDVRTKVTAEIIAQATANPRTKTQKYRVSSMLDHIEDAKERAANFGKFMGLSSGYPSIDKLTKGFVAGEITVIAGKTSYGKTSMAVNIANRIALAGHRVLFVTMEMTHAEITARYIHINGSHESDAFLTVATNTIFQENEELHWEDIDGLMANAKQELDVDIVIIDHLHYFTRELENAAEDLGRITKQFKQNAKQHNIPVILISHVRKTFNDKEATMDDLRGSSFIGQDSDIVLMVGRNPDDDSEMRIKCEKNRARGVIHGNGSDVAQLIFDKTRILEPVEKLFETKPSTSRYDTDGYTPDPDFYGEEN